MKLEIERLAFDSLRNLGEVAEPVKQKSLCDYARVKGKVTNMKLEQPAQAVRGLRSSALVLRVVGNH